MKPFTPMILTANVKLTFAISAFVLLTAGCGKTELRKDIRRIDQASEQEIRFVERLVDICPAFNDPNKTHKLRLYKPWDRQRNGEATMMFSGEIIATNKSFRIYYFPGEGIASGAVEPSGCNTEADY